MFNLLVFNDQEGIDPMAANIPVILIVFGYAGFLVYKLIQGTRIGTLDKITI